MRYLTRRDLTPNHGVRARQPSIVMALALTAVSALAGCAEMIASAGRDAVTVPPGSPIAKARRLGVLQTACAQGTCTPAQLQGANQRMQSLFRDTCYDVVDAPEFKSMDVGIGLNVGGKTIDVAMNPLGLKIGGSEGPAGGAALGFLLPPGLTDEMVRSVAKKYGMGAVVSSSLTVGKPDATTGFTPLRVAFTVMDVDARTQLFRGAMDGQMMRPDEPDRDLDGAFMVLRSGMEQKASLCAPAAAIPQ